MLELMRAKAATWVVRILSLFLILSFAAWGIGDVFRTGGTSDTVAEVGDAAITRDELARQYRRAIEQLQRVMGGEFDSQKAREMGLLDRTLDSMINGRLVSEKARDLGLVAGDSLVKNQIYNDPSFQGPGGTFDTDAFHRALAGAGMNEAMYVASLRSGLVANQLTSAIVAGAAAPDPLQHAIYRYRGEKRVAEVLRVPNASLPPVAEPTQGELAAFHDKNKAMFTAPELRQLTVMFLDPDLAAKDVKPAEEDVKSAYQERLPSMSVAERRDVKHMLLPDQATAKKAHEELVQGRAFDAVAKELAKQSPQDTDLGMITRRDLTPALAEIAFKLKPGTVSAPIQTALGWHILAVDKVQPGHTPTLAEVRSEIVHDLARDLAVNQLVKTANQLEDALAGGATLEEAAAKIGIKAVHVGPVDSKGQLASGVAPPGVPKGPKFIDTAFKTREGEGSGLVETQGGGYFVLRVDKVIAPAVRPLDEVRDTVAAAWRAQAREAKGRARAEALLQRAKGGEGLEAIAKEMGLKPVTTQPFNRFAGDPTGPLPPRLVAPLFKASVGEAVMAPYDDGFALARLTDAKSAAAAGAAADAAPLQKELTQGMQRDILAQFDQALRDRYEVTIHRDAVDSIQ
jgi:peptidyl-prolyl cis-trans isomerase D